VTWRGITALTALTGGRAGCSADVCLGVAVGEREAPTASTSCCRSPVERLVMGAVTGCSRPEAEVAVPRLSAAKQTFTLSSRDPRTAVRVNSRRIRRYSSRHDSESGLPMSLLARLLLAIFAALCGVMMLAWASQADPGKAWLSYLFGVFCFAIALVCFLRGRVAHFVGGLIAAGVLATGLAYLASMLLHGPLITGRQSDTSVFNAILFLVVFGFPATKYLRTTKFGLASTKTAERTTLRRLRRHAGADANARRWRPTMESNLRVVRHRPRLLPRRRARSFRLAVHRTSREAGTDHCPHRRIWRFSAIRCADGTWHLPRRGLAQSHGRNWRQGALLAAS